MTTLTFAAGSTTHVTVFDVNGAPADLVVIQSDSSAAHFIVADGADIGCAYLDITYSHASPADTWYAGASVDSGNNTGWVFASAGDTIYIPNDYPDIGTALMAADSGDTLVFTASGAYSTHDLTSALHLITVRAATGIVPVLDHTNATTHGLEVTGVGWTFEGVTFRSRDGGGGSALILTGTTGHTLTGLAFEGCARGIVGGTFTLSQSTFRRVSTECIATATAAIIESCLFLYAAGAAVTAALANVRNCTFIGCECAGRLVDADVVTNCTAQACEAT